MLWYRVNYLQNAGLLIYR